MASHRPPKDGRDADEAALAARLRKLGAELGAVARGRGGDRDRDGDARQTTGGSGIGRALRLSGDFIGGIVVGAFLGWLFDRLTGWSPWGLFAFMLLGFTAGTLNALRSAGLVTPRNGSGKRNGAGD